MKYTEKIHAKRLLGMLNKKNPCGYCPAGRRYGSHDFDDMGWENLQCEICIEFIVRYANLNSWECPCHALGKKKAIKITWLALEEKGYLE